MQLVDETYGGRKDKCSLVLVVSQNTTYRGCATERRRKTASCASCHISRERLHRGGQGSPAKGLGSGLPLRLAAASRLSHSSPLRLSGMAGSIAVGGKRLWAYGRAAVQEGLLGPFPRLPWARKVGPCLAPTFLRLVEPGPRGCPMDSWSQNLTLHTDPCIKHKTEGVLPV